jgi:hypothetical protein
VRVARVRSLMAAGMLDVDLRMRAGDPSAADDRSAS